MRSYIYKPICIAKYLLLISFTISVFSCHQTNEPSQSVKQFKWRVDTLVYPGSFQTDMVRMFATSSSNIYIVGHNDQSVGHMFHYNGISWSAVQFNSFPKPPELKSIHGTSPSNIWAVGSLLYNAFDSTRQIWVIVDSAFAMYFNGNAWKASPIAGRGQLESVWSFSSKDVWAVGDYGLMRHFDGNRWVNYDLPGRYHFYDIAGNNPLNVYAIASQSDFSSPIDSSGYFLFSYNGLIWAKIDSVMDNTPTESSRFGRTVWSNGSSVYSLDPGLFILNGSHWNKLASIHVNRMWSINTNNLLAVGKSVYYYNSGNWTEYSAYDGWSNTFWTDCYMNDMDAFVIGNDNWRTYILHGQK